MYLPENILGLVFKKREVSSKLHRQGKSVLPEEGPQEKAGRAGSGLQYDLSVPMPRGAGQMCSLDGRAHPMPSSPLKVGQNP